MLVELVVSVLAKLLVPVLVSVLELVPVELVGSWFAWVCRSTFADR